MTLKTSTSLSEKPEALHTEAGGIIRKDAQKPPQSLLSPEKLKVLLLQGKISQGEYLHQLRTFNSVLADTTLREGKKGSVQAVVVQTVDSKNSHSGQSTQSANSESPPTSSSVSHKADGEGDSGKARELKQVAERLQKREQFDRVVISNIFENDNREVQRAHQERDTEKQEEEKLQKEQQRDDKLKPEDVLKKVFDHQQEEEVTASMAQKLEEIVEIFPKKDSVFQALKKLIFQKN